MFDVGRSMFDVHLLLRFLNDQIGRPWARGGAYMKPQDQGYRCDRTLPSWQGTMRVSTEPWAYGTGMLHR